MARWSPARAVRCFRKEGVIIYRSEQEANGDAWRMWAAKRVELEPYKCQECGFWHLREKTTAGTASSKKKEEQKAS